MEADGGNLSALIGRKFSSFTEVVETLKVIEEQTFAKFYIRDSRRIESHRLKLKHIQPELVYSELKYSCFRGGRKIRKRGKGIRENTSTFQNECPACISFRVTKDGNHLEVKSYNDEHNHELSKVMYSHLPHQRSLPQEVTETAKELLRLKCNKKLLQKKLQEETGKVVTLRDLSNMNISMDKDNERSLITGVKLLKEKYNADVEILQIDDNTFQGLFFQTEAMKGTMEAFPEFIALDGTYKLLDINVTVFVFLVEDGNCESEIVAICILVNEDSASVNWMVKTFKNNNQSSESTKCIMTDKDLNERATLKKYFPQAKLLLCVFHTLRTFNREISCEKLGISQTQRLYCLEVLEKMVQARSERAFVQSFNTLMSIAPEKVKEYYLKNWHDIKDEWHLGKEFHSSNFLNSTNNRVECLNSKLKSVITKNSTLNEFLDKLFVIIHSLENERDHKAIMGALKNPILHSRTISNAEYQYSKKLTQQAFHFVKNEMEQIEKQKINETENKNFIAEDKAEGHLQVNDLLCSCNFYLSMTLPCRHIFAVRKQLQLDLFNEDLCKERWTSDYYLKHQRIFREPEGQEHQSRIKLTTEKTKKPKTVGEKRRCAMKTTDTLVDWLSLQNSSNFERHIQTLKTLLSFWETGTDVSIIPFGTGALNYNLDDQSPNDEMLLPTNDPMSSNNDDQASSLDETALGFPISAPSTVAEPEDASPSSLVLDIEAQLSNVKMPKAIKRKGKPKGHDKTVIGLPKRKLKNNEPTPFILLPIATKQKKMLEWWMGSESAEKVIKLEVTFGPAAVKDVPDEFSNDAVDLILIKKYFTEEAYGKLLHNVASKRLDITCQKCSTSRDKSFISCDKCFKWFHCVCDAVYRKPRQKYWFCNHCSSKTK